MSTVFDVYPTESSTLGASAVPTEETTAEDKRQSVFSRRQEKILIKICKLLKKQNKLLIREMKSQTIEINDTKKCRTEKEGDKEAKGFFRDLGKAICKAVPTILTTLTSMAFNFIFMRKGRSGKCGLQLA